MRVGVASLVLSLAALKARTRLDAQTHCTFKTGEGHRDTGTTSDPRITLDSLFTYFTNPERIRNMQLLKGIESGSATQKSNRKLLKPQVERRRRERMNRSLESLRALLLQGPQHQALAARRVEKAEVLEHTVLFLQSAGHRGAAEGRQQQDFQDGFSTCLQRAAHFLRDARGGRWGQGALGLALSRHLTLPGQSPRAPISPHSPHAQPKGQCARLGGQNGPGTQQHGAALRNSPPQRQTAPPNLPQRPHRDTLSPPTHSPPLWRPWP